MAKAGRGSDQFPLRLPEGLRERIKIVADKNGRSMNAEIIEVLEEKFPAAWPIESALGKVRDLIKILRVGVSIQAADDVLFEMLDVLNGIEQGTVSGVSEESKQSIKDLLDDWKTDLLKEEAILAHNRAASVDGED